MTPGQLSDALGCFWNAAIGHAQDSRSEHAIAAVSSIAVGIHAICARLDEQEEAIRSELERTAR